MNKSVGGLILGVAMMGQINAKESKTTKQEIVDTTKQEIVDTTKQIPNFTLTLERNRDDEVQTYYPGMFMHYQEMQKDFINIHHKRFFFAIAENQIEKLYNEKDKVTFLICILEDHISTGRKIFYENKAHEHDIKENPQIENEIIVFGEDYTNSFNKFAKEYNLITIEYIEMIKKVEERVEKSNEEDEIIKSEKYDCIKIFATRKQELKKIREQFIQGMEKEKEAEKKYIKSLEEINAYEKDILYQYTIRQNLNDTLKEETIKLTKEIEENSNRGALKNRIARNPFLEESEKKIKKIIEQQDSARRNTIIKMKF